MTYPTVSRIYVSFLLPKLTNLLKSENTSLRCTSVFPPASLEPVDGPLGPGPEDTELKMPSPPNGRVTLLAPGLMRLPPAWPVAAGSISSEERKDVLSRSVFVLVMVRKESNRLFCEAFGVPFRSKIFTNSPSLLIFGSMNGENHLLEIINRLIPNQHFIIEIKPSSRIHSSP